MTLIIEAYDQYSNKILKPGFLQGFLQADDYKESAGYYNLTKDRRKAYSNVKFWIIRDTETSASVEVIYNDYFKPKTCKIVSHKAVSNKARKLTRPKWAKIRRKSHV